MQRVQHPLEPVFDQDSKILMLGTMPSPKSRELGFYYMHPQNRFWKVIAEILRKPIPQTNQERKKFLLQTGIALWDVLNSCQIEGADDGSIREPVPNDLNRILSVCHIRAIFTTGQKAAQLYQKFCFPKTGIRAYSLPSTSPANCRYYSYEKLVEAYRVILPFLKEEG